MLPVETVLPELRRALALAGAAVLTAPPGAGKTTLVPLALLDEPWLGGRRVLILEPRRLAARAAARRMADMLGERTGDTVGYRMRSETKVGPRTRVEVVTEGVLTRLLLADPTLEGYGIVIFDEFHERSLEADLGLALCLDIRSKLRDDLRILVMSATLQGEPVSALLGDAPVIVCEGRSYPVETFYLDRPVTADEFETAVSRAIGRAWNLHGGDILVFLPGAREIRRVGDLLREADWSREALIVPLHGSLPQKDQDAALAPPPPGKRKIVLATSVAETSITVEGIRVVVDGGRMRVPRFSPRTGLTRLETVPVSRASAEQRRGRAGRTAPGVCYRLWTRTEDDMLAPDRDPEIVSSDLASLALELAAWGAADPAELRWLDPPPDAAFRQARRLLRELGAIGPDGLLTERGRAMAELGVHPRLAHMMLRAVPLGLARTACELAAMIEETGGFRNGSLDGFLGGSRWGGGDAAVDVCSRLEAYRAGGFDPAIRRRIAERSDRLLQRLSFVSNAIGKNAVGAVETAGAGTDACGLLLAFAYPDRIARRRQDGKFLLASGRGAVLSRTADDPLARSAYIVAAELDDGGADARIFAAAPLSEDDLLRHFGDRLETEHAVEWDRSSRSVRARRRLRLGEIVLREEPFADPDPGAVQEALTRGIRTEGLGILPWTKQALQLRGRMAFMRLHEPDWPDVSDDALLERLEAWLGPHLAGMRGADDLRCLNVAAALSSMLAPEQRRELEACAPTHVVLPDGSRAAIDYGDPSAPALFVRVQQLFGLAETPRIARGRVPLTLHLLSPAGRPVHVTRDLAGFWRGAYFDVRRELRGRYPKHAWPDDPERAKPAARHGSRV